jgi:hypothetical protein
MLKKSKKRPVGHGGWKSGAGIGTRHGLDGPEIDSGDDEISRTHPDRTWGPPSLLAPTTI